MEHPILNPPNPYVGSLRIFPGTLIKVAGQARPNATRFAVNLQTGPSLNPRDDLALHLSPCFTPPRIVRNTLRSGAWGLEEAWGNGTVLNPFQPFEIMILAEQDQFKIAVNGSHYCEFKYRIPYHEISHLTIDGDVDIERLTITGPSQAPTYQQPSAPYPTPSVGPGMPVPQAYPYLPPNSASSSSGPYPTPNSGPYPTPTSGPYPTPSAYQQPSMPGGPMPTGNTYMGGFPQGGPQYPQPGPQYPNSGSQYPGQAPPGPYPQSHHGPMPTGAGYQGGQPHQPGHSSSSAFGSLPIGGKALGTIAGLGLGAAAGAAALSVVGNPLKSMKKMMKPKKMFKHKGWGRSSSSSSNSSRSSRSSFSSNSS